jgi:Bacterial Ig domain
VNIARLVNDYIDFLAQTNGVTELYNGNNQRWVKTEIVYTTSNILDLNLAQLPTTTLLLQGYGYGLDGQNSQPPTNKILLSGGEFKVNRGGVFNLPILIDEPTSTIDAVDETINIFFQDTVLNVLSNDNLGFAPTIIKSINTTMPATVGTLVNNGSSIQFVKGSGSIVSPQTFSYTIQDSFSNESTATVTLNITAVPTTPTATNDSYTSNAVDIIDLLVLNNDALGNTPTTITSVNVTGFGLGSVAISGGNKLVFTPNGTEGTDTFTYTITDNTAATSTGTVTIVAALILATSFYYEGIYASDNEAAPGWGTVVYIDSDGLTAFSDELWAGECREIIAQSIVSTTYVTTCTP